MVYLIYRQHYRLFGTAQHFGNLNICCSQPFAAVYYEYYNVRCLYCQFGLPAHLLAYYVLPHRLYAAGIYKRERMGEPFAVCIYPVACNAGRIFNYRYALSCYFVEKRGLAHVRAANYGHKRLCHIISPRLTCQTGCIQILRRRRRTWATAAFPFRLQASPYPFRQGKRCRALLTYRQE